MSSLFMCVSLLSHRRELGVLPVKRTHGGEEEPERSPTSGSVNLDSYRPGLRSQGEKW